jgi:flagellar biosynthesis chaperone FliJ
VRAFRFRLQRALRFSLLRENQKKAQIAAGLQRTVFLERYLAQLEKGAAVALALSSRSFHSLEAEAHRQSIVPALLERRRMESLLAEEREFLTIRQLELKRLSQRRRSLESLSEKHRSIFLVERSRDEQKAIDDAFNLTRNREMKSK